jgi:hypothetical protein
MKNIVELDGISSFEELMGNSNYFLQVAVNSWFRDEPELEVKICDCGCIEGDTLDVVQLTAHRKDQDKDQATLIPLLVNASINQLEGKFFLAPISVWDSHQVEYFSRQISLTEETFNGVISRVKPLIDIGPICFPGHEELHMVGTAFHVTYDTANSGHSEAVIYSKQCFVVKNAQGLWIPTSHLWN